MSSVLVTGGAGYIGSHACASLIEAGHRPILVDNFSNSSLEVINRIEQLSGVRPAFITGDILDAPLLDQIFDTHKVSAVMHFAGLKAVGESVNKPLDYYHNNVTGSITLLRAMQRAGLRNLVFSSSATVYGDPIDNPIKEDFPRGATNPYGQTKLTVENLLTDLHASGDGWNIACLRYFNPVGAHKSGLIGEAPGGIPNNLMPFVSQVAVGRHDKLKVFGRDYPTIDGTGVRDYIHVVDLAEGHLAALNYLSKQKSGLLSVNLGRGAGVSVLEMVTAFEKASGRKIPFEFVERRKGDIAECWADATAASNELGWSANRGVDEMCTDTWRWQSNNPDGYGD